MSEYIPIICFVAGTVAMETCPQCSLPITDDPEIRRRRATCECNLKINSVLCMKSAYADVCLEAEMQRQEKAKKEWNTPEAIEKREKVNATIANFKVYG